MDIERKVHEFYAKGHGYFWLPCQFPGCGREFGGHERGTYTIRDRENPNLGSMTCPKHNGFASAMWRLRSNVYMETYVSDNELQYWGDPEQDIAYCRDRGIPLPDYERKLTDD